MPDAFDPDASIPETLGLSFLAKLIFDQGDVAAVWDPLIARATVDPLDAGALMDLSMILQLTGQTEQGLAVQAQALEVSPVYRRRRGEGPKVLALMAPGGFMANTPLDFLLDGSAVDLRQLYLGQGAAAPQSIPEHDVAFLAIGESDANRSTLLALAPELKQWARPILNSNAEQIAGLTRDGVADLFAASDHVVAPPVRRLVRAQVAAIAAGDIRVDAHLRASAFPVIVRPVDSHAGLGLEKIDDPAALAAYLEGQAGDEFYLTAFVDYRSEDGCYRKYRIAFIGGEAFASHLAISARWMVHYLNADMAEFEGLRAEEAEFMANFETDFAQRHAAAFAEMHAAFGLDYFAIDCGETRDGRLLLFEADVAMIVHAMDSETLYPYKKPAMLKLFAAFQAMIDRAAGRSGAGSIAA